MFNNMAWPDFTLVFEGGEVPCHKEVLAAASSVFEAMVGNNHKEAIEGKANIKISAEVGRAFVRYIYTEDVERELMKEQASAFLSLGEMYNLQGLKDAAELELLSQLKRENMVDMIHLGELHRAEDLFEAALRMTKVNMSWLRNQVNIFFSSEILYDETSQPGGGYGDGGEAEQRYLGETSLKHPLIFGQPNFLKLSNFS